MTILNKIKSKKDKTPTNKDKDVDKHDDARVNPRPPAVASQPASRAGRGGQGHERAGSSHPRQSALLIKQPWVTEKAGDLSALRKYIFIADRKTNKLEAKKAIESIYGVKVESVNIINIKGKAKRLGRSLGRTSAHKKVIVTLGEGQKIDIIPT